MTPLTFYVRYAVLFHGNIKHCRNDPNFYAVLVVVMALLGGYFTKLLLVISSPGRISFELLCDNTHMQYLVRIISA